MGVALSHKFTLWTTSVSFENMLVLHQPAEAAAETGQQSLTIQQALDLALQHHNADRLPEAKNIYRQVGQAEPNLPAALHLPGVLFHQVGQNDHATGKKFVKIGAGK